MSYRAAPPRDELLRALAAEAAEAETRARAETVDAELRVEQLEGQVKLTRHLIGGWAERLRELEARATADGESLDPAVEGQLQAARARGQEELEAGKQALESARRRLALTRRALLTAQQACERAERDVAQLDQPR